MRSAGDKSTAHGVLGWLEDIDAPTAVRGASTGFSVLVIGGLLAPVTASLLPMLGRTVWLPLVAILAFVVAATRIGEACRPAVHGAVAAFSSYLLVLPLVVLNESGRDPVQIAATFGTACGVGALTGYLRGRSRYGGS